MSIETRTDDYGITTYSVEGIGVSKWAIGDDEPVTLDFTDTVAVSMYETKYALSAGPEVKVMACGNLTGSDERGTVHTTFTPAQARALAEVLLTAAREAEEDEASLSDEDRRFVAWRQERIAAKEVAA